MHFNYFLNNLENDQELYNIKIDYRLTVLNPLHGKRFLEFQRKNNQMSTEEDKEISLLMV